MGDDAVLLDSVNESRTPESSLLDHVERVAHSRSGRFAVHVKLSGLQAHNKQPHHVRIASRSFDTLLNATEAQLYILTNGDLFLLCRDLRVDDVDYVIDKVRTLFKGDLLTRANPATGADDFTTWFDLELDFQSLHETVSDLAAGSDQPNWIREDASAGRGASTEFAGQALDPVGLGKIDDSIRRSRIADLVREQSAVIIGADGTERILFKECYVSIGELQSRHAPGFNLISNLWLFQHLTETIDSRLLAFLSRTDIGSRTENISINLNTSTVLSSVFQAFDQAIGAASAKVTIEFQLVDIFADLDRYTEARDWLRERGYRVLIDGVNPMSIRYFDASLLKPDFVKVGWGVEFAGNGSIEDSAEMMEIVERIGAKRLILARTDSEAALTWALTHGIRRFQGFFIDRLVAQQLAKDGRLPGDRDQGRGER